MLFSLHVAGNILDNQELIATLESAKSKAVEIAEKLEAANVTAREIDEVRVRYTPVAKRGAILFFVMAGLANITNMYEYSLASFLRVFNNTLATSKRDASFEGRLRNVIEALTYDVYNYTCLGRQDPPLHYVYAGIAWAVRTNCAFVLLKNQYSHHGLQA